MNLKHQLKLAQAELVIRQREFNAAQRNLDRVLVQIATLEKKLELLERSSKTAHATQ